MAVAELSIALKFIAKNATNPELKKIADNLGNIGLAAKAAQISFNAFRNVAGFMACANLQ